MGTDFSVWHTGGANDGEPVFRSTIRGHELESDEPVVGRAGERLRLRAKFQEHRDVPAQVRVRHGDVSCRHWWETGDAIRAGARLRRYLTAARALSRPGTSPLRRAGESGGGSRYGEADAASDVRWGSGPRSRRRQNVGTQPLDEGREGTFEHGLSGKIESDTNARDDSEAVDQTRLRSRVQHLRLCANRLEQAEVAPAQLGGDPRPAVAINADGDTSRRHDRPDGKGFCARSLG